jgi:hypothetical protein
MAQGFIPFPLRLFKGTKMNYARHRELAKKKLQEKQAVLAKMNGAERTKAEAMLIGQAVKELEAPAEVEQAPEPRKPGRPPKKAE